MTRQGRYKISASLTHPSLSGLAFETPEKLISINTGTRLKQKNFGVVDMKDSSVIHPRSYDIISFKEQEGDVVCLKVYDKNWVYALMRLGPYVDGVKLNHDVDTFSNIHVLVQVKPRIFLHEVFSDTGTIKQFIVYRATFENVPIMTRDSKLGTIRIYGGEKLIEGEDYIRDGNTIVLRNMEPEAN
jgi:hypothetical protein